ncbi:hypothetical protein DAI22_06g120801 [Oryza sativa Japonica Group]|nr:hypothetical protein DAI22_06g120801 [Oryza sativa Japonica Group]
MTMGLGFRAHERAHPLDARRPVPSTPSAPSATRESAGEGKGEGRTEEGEVEEEGAAAAAVVHRICHRRQPPPPPPLQLPPPATASATHCLPPPHARSEPGRERDERGDDGSWPARSTLPLHPRSSGSIGSALRLRSRGRRRRRGPARSTPPRSRPPLSSCRVGFSHLRQAGSTSTSAPNRRLTPLSLPPPSVSFSSSTFSAHGGGDSNKAVRAGEAEVKGAGITERRDSCRPCRGGSSGELGCNAERRRFRCGAPRSPVGSSSSPPLSFSLLAVAAALRSLFHRLHAAAPRRHTIWG